ncbi:carbonic anhydrase [Nocardia paucivorans]|uniref:carbonic anhydrase n=1 Tax=Nocardia paucivorans TaxID=114259 RepID=UPI000684BE6A|nr:carbonic anhydrase family protein [Nocardia paucivorans]
MPDHTSLARTVFTRRRALTALAAAAIGGGTFAFAGHREHGVALRSNAPHWDYDAEGPAHWAELDQSYRTCAGGHAQSPIDLPAHTELHPDDHIDIEYGVLETVETTNNGHTVQANVPAGNGNRILIAGRPYELTQFHFHTPSEHTIDGAGAAMELHLVHTGPGGALAVLAILLQPDGGRSPFASLLTDPPAELGASVRTGPLDLRVLLPANRAQFRYEGSLTTPPCSEGVTWTVLRHPMSVAGSEVDRYRALFPHSNRPVQPRYGRPVTVTGN